MRDCSLATLPCISREQEPWEDQVGVENGSAEEPPKCVCGYTWKGSGSENGDEVSESTCCLLLCAYRIERGSLKLFRCNCILLNLEFACSEL